MSKYDSIDLSFSIDRLDNVIQPSIILTVYVHAWVSPDGLNVLLDQLSVIKLVAR